MEKPLEIKFLEFLEPKEANPTETDVIPFVRENFSKFSEINPTQGNNIKIFLERLENKKFISTPREVDFGWPSDVEIKSKSNFSILATIKDDGIQHLYSYRINQILLETNTSTQKTNKAIRISIIVQSIMGFISLIAISLGTYFA